MKINHYFIVTSVSHFFLGIDCKNRDVAPFNITEMKFTYTDTDKSNKQDKNQSHGDYNNDKSSQGCSQVDGFIPHVGWFR